MWISLSRYKQQQQQQLRPRKIVVLSISGDADAYFFYDGALIFLLFSSANTIPKWNIYIARSNLFFSFYIFIWYFSTLNRCFCVSLKCWNWQFLVCIERNEYWPDAWFRIFSFSSIFVLFFFFCLQQNIITMPWYIRKRIWEILINVRFVLHI